MKFEKIGNYIELISSRNKDLSIKNVLGINIDKVFMPSVANTSGSDLSNYKVIRKGQFATNLMHVGRDERLPIGVYLSDEPAIVSPAYFTFRITKPDDLLSEYLMIILLQSEFDRYAGFICDSSVRGNLDWERFCEIKIPLPSKNKQHEYVAIYNNLLKLVLNHEKSFSDLRLIINTFIEKLADKYGASELQTHIRQIDARNLDLSLNNVRGISSVLKDFIKPKANMNGVSLSNYKIVKNNQFAFNPNTARMGDRIPIALNTAKPCLVSAIYPVFEIINTDELLPEFLLLWFKRPEFDRYARYNSWGSARETFDWSEMIRVRLPVPPIEVQKSIVAIYHVLETRKKMTEKLKNIIKEISPILIKDAKDKCMEGTI